MKRVLKVIVLVFVMAVPTIANAQDKVETTLSADIVSSYIWRGQDLGSASVQPTIGIGWKGLSLSAWGSYGFVDKNDMKEIDISLLYSVAGLTVGLVDQYNLIGTENDPAKYFRFRSGEKGEQFHVLEGNLGYDFGILAFNWYTNIAGADDDYSSYFDITVPFKLGINWEFNAGFVPYKSRYYFTDNFTCTNLSLKASKDIPITGMFKLPVFGQLIANPDNGKFYFVFGVSLGI